MTEHRMTFILSRQPMRLQEIALLHLHRDTGRRRGLFNVIVMGVVGAGVVNMPAVLKAMGWGEDKRWYQLGRDAFLAERNKNGYAGV